MRDNFDNLLHKAMTPDMEPSAELNEKILSNTRTSTKKKSKVLNMATRAAAVVIGLALVSPAVAFAADQIKQLRNAHITEDSVSVGNPEYIYNSEQDTEEPVTSEVLNRVEGTANDKWLYKEEIQLSNSVKNIFYGYKDYQTAIEDTKLDNWFNVEYELSTDTGYGDVVQYVEVEYDGYFNNSISATFKYNEGFFCISEDNVGGNIAEDATFTIQLSKTENSREYVNKAGVGFVLVDDRRTEDLGEEGTNEKVVTVVIITYPDYTGFIEFHNLSDDEIHQVLDTVTVKNDGE